MPWPKEMFFRLRSKRGFQILLRKQYTNTTATITIWQSKQEFDPRLLPFLFEIIHTCPEAQKDIPAISMSDLPPKVYKWMSAFKQYCHQLPYSHKSWILLCSKLGLPTISTVSEVLSSISYSHPSVDLDLFYIYRDLVG